MTDHRVRVIRGDLAGRCVFAFGYPREQVDGGLVVLERLRSEPRDSAADVVAGVSSAASRGCEYAVGELANFPCHAVVAPSNQT
ncbi:MAG TPA: hypothetical protein VIM08_04545 [Arthrobacter sp.]